MVLLRNISRSAAVRGDRKDAQHFRVDTIRETDICLHPRQTEIKQADCRFHGIQQIGRAALCTNLLVRIDARRPILPEMIDPTTGSYT
jgi:competence transcription factor ComK